MSRPEFRPDDSFSDPAHTLEQHILAGFPPDLALDLVLNELVVRAAEATRATGAALALLRDDEMVCRAAAGRLAPDLGVPLNTRDGLSGACLETHQPQLSVDTEFDPRLDPAVSRTLGIRSLLIVPVFDFNDRSQFSGVLEVFSAVPAAFSTYDQKLLEAFAGECARIRQAALIRSQSQPDAQLMEPENVRESLFPGDPAVRTAEESRPQTADEISPFLQRFGKWKQRLKSRKGDRIPIHEDLAHEDLAHEHQVHEDQAHEDRAYEQRDYGNLTPLPISPELMPPELLLHKFTAAPESATPELARPESALLESPLHSFAVASVPPARRPSYEAWTLILGSLAILAIIAVSFLIGFRIGWVHLASTEAKLAQPVPPEAAPAAPILPAAAARPAKQSSPASETASEKASRQSASRQSASRQSASRQSSSRESSPPSDAPASGELVVYEKGKVIFRLKPPPAATELAQNSRKRVNGRVPTRQDTTSPDQDPIVEASSMTRIPTSPVVWISPGEAEQRLLTRAEPYYPPEALAAHRAGNVVLEVQVDEEGAVSKIRTLSGDPLLAAAATEAVRNWHYQPYRQQDQPAQFQTDVTINFALPN